MRLHLEGNNPFHGSLIGDTLSWPVVQSLFVWWVRDSLRTKFQGSKSFCAKTWQLGLGLKDDRIQI